MESLRFSDTCGGIKNSLFPYEYLHFTHFSPLQAFLSLSLSLPPPLALQAFQKSNLSVRHSLSLEMANTPTSIDIPTTLGSQPEPNPAGVTPTLNPMESRNEVIIDEEHDGVLPQNYDILLSVRLFYQNPTKKMVKSDDITLFERMFMASLRLPFPEIARDFVLFLMVASSQIMPNAWRYLFTSYILWKTVLGEEVSIL